MAVSLLVPGVMPLCSYCQWPYFTWG